MLFAYFHSFTRKMYVVQLSGDEVWVEQYATWSMDYSEAWIHGKFFTEVLEEGVKVLESVDVTERGGVSKQVINWRLCLYEIWFGQVNDFPETYSFPVDWTLTSHRGGEEGTFSSNNI